MNGWIVAFLLAVIVALPILLWYRWGAPWREFDQLTRSMAEGGVKPRLLYTGNSRLARIARRLGELQHERSELEARLDASESRTHAIFDAVLDGVAVLDDNRRIRLANAAMERLFSRRPFTPGLSLLEVTRNADIDRLVAAALETREPQQGDLAFTLEGAEARMQASAVPLPRGEPGGAVVLLRDVTRLHASEQLRRDFVANVSHELRTPLSILNGYIETLLDDPGQPPEELDRIVRVMERHARRLTLLVEDILSLARLEAPSARLQLAEIHLPKFLEGILRDWQKRFETKKLRCRLACPDSLPAVQADEDRLAEIVYNLLDNAVKYSHPEGEIRVEVSHHGDWVRLAIADEGIGISARDLPRVFERFYRADQARSRAQGGTGLGLAIVKHIAQLHGGAAEAVSRTAEGATITVTLPIAGPETVTKT